MATQKSIKYTSFNILGEQLSFNQELELNVISESGNYLIHRNLLRHYSLQHQCTASTKTRGEVRGGGRKPWRQKGTGRARAGSNRSPLWKGGGVIFGPKYRKKKLKINKKERRLALQTLLYNKKNSSFILHELEKNFAEIKTKKFTEVLLRLNLKLNKKILVIVSEKTKFLKLSSKNLKNIELISASNLNIFSLLKAKQIVLTTSALNIIKETYGKQKLKA